MATHFDWSNQPDQSPTTLQVLYAQEDLWVLTSLMHIIRQTNGQVESRHEAVVKTIETILIGRHAPPRSGQVTRLGGGGGGGGMMGGMMGSMGGMSDMGGSAMPAAGEASAGMPGAGSAMMPTPSTGGASDMATPGGEMGGMMPGMGRVSADPAEGRYVDNQYQALKAETLRSALRSPTPNDAFLVVAKRMPVRMRLIVDERKLPRLLAQLGNSMLPVEVRQVRINRGKEGGGGFDMMGGGGGYGMMGGGGGYGAMMGGGASDMGSGYGAMMGAPAGMTPGAPAGMGMGMGMGMGGYGDMPGMGGPSYASPGSGGGYGGYSTPGQECPDKGRTRKTARPSHPHPNTTCLWKSTESFTSITLWTRRNWAWTSNRRSQGLCNRQRLPQADDHPRRRQGGRDAR